MLKENKLFCKSAMMFHTLEHGQSNANMTHRRRNRTRKFNFNMSWYGTLYKRIKGSQKTWSLYHNPLHDPENIFLSFSNPNYQFEDQLKMKSSKMNKDVNIYDEVDVTTISLLDNKSASEKYSNKSEKQRLLAELSADSSSEDEDGSEKKDLKQNTWKNEKNLMQKGDRNSHVENTNSGKKSTGFLDYYSMLESKAKEKSQSISSDLDLELEWSGITSPVSQAKVKFDINSPDSGIHSDARSDDGSHVHGPVNDDVYSVVNKSSEQEGSEETTPTGDAPEKVVLPAGWEKCEDEEGAYYWHIKSGTIQREPPSPAPPDVKQTTLRSLSVKSNSSSGSTNGSVPSSPSSVSSNTEDPLKAFEGHALQYAAKSLQNISTKQEVQPEQKKTDPHEKPVRFAVQSLGWVRIAEEDLTPERSSRAVNKCIVDLSFGRNDINDVVGRWGDGKDLYMDLDKDSLRLVDTQDFTTLNSQPIQSIRVWGVGRDNGRDFAYVARDKTTRKHMCHVFRCDTPARHIANTLRDICKKIMLERHLEQNAVVQRLSRPTDLPNLDKANGQTNGQKLSFQSLYSSISFPTPMEEPKKIIRCHYLGMEMVSKPTGTDVLNNAIESLYSRIPPEKWIFVDVAIAPSTLTITEHGKPENRVDDCRIRYLSFMGIAMENAKLGGFIIHGAEDQFYAHVFHCEPSAGPLCKTIEAACKLRFQKYLDAHGIQTPTPTQKNKLENIGATFKAGVKASAEGVQSGVKASLHGVQSVFSLLKSKVKSDPT
ncbi:amyloid beta precursor protein binding family B member 2-like isoform X1 [Saccostrea cucullata]|uniref:amyloid beta precursor protein binding family B member 2-like isoform X1 n=1 Tax=Saccostrea cuccullata TaxID=36930 RepID=UPI002ED5365E